MTKWKLPIVLFALPALAGAAAITNGGFEANVCTGAVCSVTPSGWTLLSGNVEIVTTALWQPHSGSNSVDMDGVSFGSIRQTVATVAGASYELSFWLSGNPAGPPTVKQLRVSAGSASQDFTFDVTGHSTSNMGWTLKTFGFTAPTSSTAITFRSLDTVGGAYGPVLDDVSIVELQSGVPEPATFGLAGLAAAALLALRRRR